MDKNLLSKGGSSDPLVTLELGGEKRSSTCKPKCLAPTWQEGFVLPAEDGAGELVVTVWDQDLASGNDFMGVARVDLEALAHRKVHRAWYPLQAKGGGAAKGSVELALRRIHDPALALPTPPAMLADEAHAGEAANCVDVHLLRARDLPIMDRHLLGKGGSSDPVATVEVAGAKRSSKCKKKSLAPVWQESFSLAADGDDAIAVTVWDQDLALPTPPAMLEAEAQPDEAPNCVAIHLVRAKGLPVMDKNLLSKGGSSDPVVTFALPGAETQTSTCKAKCLAPRWREDFALAADDAAGETLVVTVFDQDLASGNDFMGAVEVPLAALGDRAVHRAWHPLRSKAGEAAPGAVELCLRLYHDPARALPLPASFRAPEAHPGQPPNCVTVHLLRAKDLPVMDKNLLSKGGSSDPVVTLEVAGFVATSTTKRKQLDPVWEETFKMPLDAGDRLEVTVEDADVASGNDFMGAFKVDSAELADGATLRA